jgi:MFS family permease
LPLAAAATIHVSRLRLVLTILLPSAVNFFSSFTNAIITVGLPIIAHSLALPRSLYLWPSSIYGLTAGAMLLIAGATADIIGARRVELAGIFCLGVFTLACGLSATGIQLVVFRGVQGVASAMHLPASVAMVTTAVPPGRARNIGFACLGLSQPLGFSVGLVISGVMIERAGWRSGFYLCSAATLVIAMIAIRGLPQSNAEHQGMGLMLNKMAHEIDWVGGLIASGGLTMLSYVLA